MTNIKRGLVIDVDLNPIRGAETGKVRPCVVVTNNVYNERLSIIQVVPLTAWSEKKGRIVTNIELLPTKENGLTKRSVADCLQTRPVDYRLRLVHVRGSVTVEDLAEIDQALKIVFALE